AGRRDRRPDRRDPPQRSAARRAPGRLLRPPLRDDGGAPDPARPRRADPDLPHLARGRERGRAAAARDAHPAAAHDRDDPRRLDAAPRRHEAADRQEARLGPALPEGHPDPLLPRQPPRHRDEQEEGDDPGAREDHPPRGVGASHREVSARRVALALAFAAAAAAPLRAQSAALRDEAEFIEALARDGFSDVAHRRLDALRIRITFAPVSPEWPADAVLVARVAARLARADAAAAAPDARAEVLRRGSEELAAELAEAAAASPAPDLAPLRLESVELARA